MPVQDLSNKYKTKLHDYIGDILGTRPFFKKKIQIERFIRDQTAILLQKFCASMIYSKVIFRSMKGADNSACLGDLQVLMG